MALAWLYLTFYAAHSFDNLRIIASPVIAGLLLLGWSAYVLLLAERKKSQDPRPLRRCPRLLQHGHQPDRPVLP